MHDPRIDRILKESADNKREINNLLKKVEEDAIWRNTITQQLAATNESVKNIAMSFNDVAHDFKKMTGDICDLLLSRLIILFMFLNI